MRFMDYFARCQIINLPYRKDRAAMMAKELEQADMPIDGKQVMLFPGIRPTAAEPFPSIGAHGCFMSHLGVLRQAHADGLANVLVMEDDLALPTNFTEVAEVLVAQLADTNWDFVYFGHILELDSNDGNPRLQAYQGKIMTAYFFAVNGKVLGRLLAFLDELLLRTPGHPDGSPMHVDGAYSTFRLQNPDVVTLVANPCLGWQRSSRSDIYPNQWFDRWPITRELAGLARHIKTLLRNR